MGEDVNGAGTVRVDGTLAPFGSLEHDDAEDESAESEDKVGEVACGHSFATRAPAARGEARHFSMLIAS